MEGGSAAAGALDAALAVMAREDPSLRASVHPETGQTLVRTPEARAGGAAGSLGWLASVEGCLLLQSSVGLSSDVALPG